MLSFKEYLNEASKVTFTFTNDNAETFFGEKFGKKMDDNPDGSYTMDGSTFTKAMNAYLENDEYANAKASHVKVKK